MLAGAIRSSNLIGRALTSTFVFASTPGLTNAEGSLNVRSVPAPLSRTLSSAVTGCRLVMSKRNLAPVTSREELSLGSPSQASEAASGTRFPVPHCVTSETASGAADRSARSPAGVPSSASHAMDGARKTARTSGRQTARPAISWGGLILFIGRRASGRLVALSILNNSTPRLAVDPCTLVTLARDSSARCWSVRAFRVRLVLKEALNLVSSACSGRSDPRMG